MEHKIKDCPLLDRNRNLTPELRPASNPKKDEWKTIVKNGKGATKLGTLPQDINRPSLSTTPQASIAPSILLLMPPPRSNLDA